MSGKRIVFALLFVIFILAAASIPTALAQDSFSSGDQGNSPGDVFNGNPNPSNADFGSAVGPGNCTGIYKEWINGRCNPRQLPGYTNCGPYYNSYQNFVQATLQHLGGACVIRNGNQLWCHQREAGMCNPDAGGRPDWSLVDSGTRLTPTCQTVCDPTVAQGGKGINVKPVKSEPKTGEPSDAKLIAGINDCLHKVPFKDPKFAFYLKPRVVKRPSQSPSDEPVTYANGTVTYDPAYLDQQPLETRVFLLGAAFAQHAQTLRDQKFGPYPPLDSSIVPESKTFGNYGNDSNDVSSALFSSGLAAMGYHAAPASLDTGENTAIVGYLYHCLEITEGLLPNTLVEEPPRDPRELYASFRGVPWNRGSPLQSGPVHNFSIGVANAPNLPLSLYPPRSQWLLPQYR